MDNDNRELIEVSPTDIFIHEAAIPAYEFDLDLTRQCAVRPQYESITALHQFEFPIVLKPKEGQVFSVIAGWSPLLATSTENRESLTVISIPDMPRAEIEDFAWHYVIAHMMRQVDHPTFYAQLYICLQRCSLSHSSIETLTGIHGKTLAAIARRLSCTSISTAKRQIKRLQFGWGELT